MLGTCGNSSRAQARLTGAFPSGGRGKDRHGMHIPEACSRGTLAERTGDRTPGGEYLCGGDPPLLGDLEGPQRGDLRASQAEGVARPKLGGAHSGQPLLASAEQTDGHGTQRSVAGSWETSRTRGGHGAGNPSPVWTRGPGRKQM